MFRANEYIKKKEAITKKLTDNSQNNGRVIAGCEQTNTSNVNVNIFVYINSRHLKAIKQTETKAF